MVRRTLIAFSLLSLLAIEIPAQVPGDFNCNGILDITDAVILSNIIQFNTPPIDTGTCVWYNGDLNSDDLYHSIADWVQFGPLFRGDPPNDNPPEPFNLDSIIAVDVIAAPGDSITVPVLIHLAEDMSGVMVQVRVDTTYLQSPAFSFGSDSLGVDGGLFYFVDGGNIYIDYIDTLETGSYVLGNVNFVVSQSAPPDSDLTIEIISDDYYPSGFSNISNPAYFVRPIMVNGVVNVRTTAIGDDSFLPQHPYSLLNYPNPFNSSTTIQFSLNEYSPVQLVIYDILGREVDRLIEAFLPAGQHEIIWNAADRPSGIYFYLLRVGDQSGAGRMTLLK